MLLFLVDLINIEIFRIPFSFFYSFYFILRSRATSVGMGDMVKHSLHAPSIKVLCACMMFYL